MTQITIADENGVVEDSIEVPGVCPSRISEMIEEVLITRNFILCDGCGRHYHIATMEENENMVLLCAGCNGVNSEDD